MFNAWLYDNDTKRSMALLNDLSVNRDEAQAVLLDAFIALNKEIKKHSATCSVKVGVA
jgi:hypothetical protein